MARRLTVEGVLENDVGGVSTLVRKDGGLFYNHTIEVRLRKIGSIAVVCLSG